MIFNLTFNCFFMKSRYPNDTLNIMLCKIKNYKASQYKKHCIKLAKIIFSLSYKSPTRLKNLLSISLVAILKEYVNFDFFDLDFLSLNFIFDTSLLNSS